jgi:hypothetical protein
MASACGSDKVDTSSPPDIITDSGGSSTDECEGTLPVVDDIWCTNSGIKPHYETGEDTVTMQVWASVSDLDGDLTSYALQIFYDEEIDESVDTDIVNFSPVYGSVDSDECTANNADLGLTLYLTGDEPAYDTLYDWGVVVTDAAGLESEVAVISCWTPASDGSDGGVE